MAAGRELTVRELESRMGGDELKEWLVFQNLYDLPDGYFVAGQVCSAIARYFTGADHPPERFVPYFRSTSPPREQTPEETRAIARVYMDAARRRSGRD